MILDLTLEQVEILFELVRSACPDEMDDRPRTKLLYALDTYLEEKAGFGPPKE
jgi:hypothetical protein